MLKKVLKIFSNDYNDVFNIETDNCSRYIKNLESFHHQYIGRQLEKSEFLKIKEILYKGIKKGDSYSKIGKEIQNIDPEIFTRAIANDIAINETGIAYGWSSNEPGKELVKKGYKLVKKWSTVKDDKVRCECKINEDSGFIPFDEPFPGTGDMFAPSSKLLNCRCRSTYRIVG